MFVFATMKRTDSQFFMHGATALEFWSQINTMEPKGDMHVTIPGYGPADLSVSYTNHYRSEDRNHYITEIESFHLFQ